MAEQKRSKSDWGPPGKLIADGVMELYDKATEGISDRIPKNSPGMRFAVKTIRKTPGLVMDGVELATAKDKTRAIVGLIGGYAGGAAGGALGAATGPAAPVAVPIGAAVGKVAGQHIAEEVYDDNSDAVRQRIEDAKVWIKDRNDHVARGLLNDMQRYTRPPQYRRPY